MAELPEVWRERTPARVDDTPPPPAPGPAEPPRHRRERGPFLTYLFLPWSYGEREPGERWHRVRCRFRRHEMAGGEMVQLGGEIVFLERRCRWCGAGAEPGTPR